MPRDSRHQPQPGLGMPAQRPAGHEPGRPWPGAADSGRLPPAGFAAPDAAGSATHRWIAAKQSAIDMSPIARPPAQGWVVDLLDRRRQLQLVTPGDAVVPPSPSGRLRDPHNTSRDLRTALDRAFAWVTSHVFRKTVATRLDEAGLSARQIADHLGHPRPSLTWDVYMGRKLASPEAAAALDRPR